MWHLSHVAFVMTGAVSVQCSGWGMQQHPPYTMVSPTLRVLLTVFLLYLPTSPLDSATHKSTGASFRQL